MVLHKRKGRWLHVLIVHLRTAFLPTINAAGLSITSDVAITASTSQGKKKKCKGRHFVAHSLLSASLMSRVQKWQSDTFIPWNWLWEEGGWNGERLWDASASWAVEDYEEERKDRWREDSRSQWGLMITFDLINERKIEVRHRIYWFPPSRTQHGFSRPETQNMQNLEKYKQWKDGWKRIAGYTM